MAWLLFLLCRSYLLAVCRVCLHGYTRCIASPKSWRNAKWYVALFLLFFYDIISVSKYILTIFAVSLSQSLSIEVLISRVRFNVAFFLSTLASSFRTIFLTVFTVSLSLSIESVDFKGSFQRHFFFLLSKYLH